ncbi:MAG: MFS transporter [Anaerolineaceae bacterium]
MDKEPSMHFRHNYIYNLLDGGFFGFGLGFGSFITILPLFVSTLTKSAILIGLIPAIHNMGWQLPQLMTAGKISRMKRFKPFVQIMTIQERLPFLLLAVVAFFIPSLGVNLALVLIYLLLIWQGLGAGLTANAWQNMIGKIFPSDYRATFFGLQSAAANLFASLGAILAGFILLRIESPDDFAICFSLTFLLMGVSWVCLNQTREQEKELEFDGPVALSVFQNTMTIMRRDVPFRWFIISRLLNQVGLMSYAFFIVYAVKYHQMSETMAGVMTSVLFITQVGANPLLGWLADHWSHSATLMIGAVSTGLSAIVALFAPSIHWFYLVFMLAGIGNTAFWTIGIAISLEFGTEVERPTYVGLSNTLIAPATIGAPVFGGWLADTFGYSTTFICSAIFAFITCFVLNWFVKDPKRNKSDEVTVIP